MSDTLPQIDVRLFLLGMLEEDKTCRIEELIMAGDDSLAQISECEDELIEDYFDKKLSPDERSAFTELFLENPARKERIALIKALRAKGNIKVKSEKKPEESKSSIWDIFRKPAFAFALAGACVLIFAAVFWRFGSNSENKALAALNDAYKKERPTESRIDGLDYAPYVQRRGAGDGNVDDLARKRAELTALDAVSNNPSAANREILGRVLLANREVEKAIEQFDLATKAEPNNAALQSDIGAAWLERSKMAVADSGEAYQARVRAIEYIEKALKLDPKMLTAKFNKGLALGGMNLPVQEKLAWEEYLALDQTSSWAEEARRKLEDLQKRQTKNRSPDSDIEDLLRASQNSDSETAFNILRTSREPITESYLVRNIVKKIVNSRDNSEKAKLLAALQFAGEVEKQRTNDKFTADIFAFYQNADESKLEAARTAHEKLSEGFAQCLRGEFKPAKTLFSEAQATFRRLESGAEAEFSNHYKIYAEYASGSVAVTHAKWQTEERFCDQNNYLWLRVATIYWLGNSNNIGESAVGSIRQYERGLKIADDLRDPYMRQRLLSGLLSEYSALNQHKQIFKILGELNASRNEYESARQAWRNGGSIAEVTAKHNLGNTSYLYSVENVVLADVLNDPLFSVDARTDAGLSAARKGDLESAENWINESLSKVDSIVDEETRKFHTSRNILAKAETELAKGEFKDAAENYRRSQQISETIEKAPFKYSTKKGLLFAELGAGNRTEAANMIKDLVADLEKDRDAMIDAEAAPTFFSTEQNVYDAASDYELDGGNAAGAFDYHEQSLARSLLSRMTDSKGAAANVRSLAEIQQSLESGTQLLTFAVHGNRTLAFVVSSENVDFRQILIDPEGLNAKVHDLISSLGDENYKPAAKDLYQLLISPVENLLDAKRSLVIIPSRSLIRLPFAALLDNADEPMIKRYTISYAPSANVFLSAQANSLKHPKPIKDSILAVGNPSFDRNAYNDLSDLPSAEREAEEIVQNYASSNILSAKNATRANLLKALPKASVFHYAGHFLSVENSPDLSRFVLAEEALTAGEIRKQHLSNVWLAVLSACSTAVEEVYEGEGAIGIASDFLAAGVPTVIATAWDVNSDSTAELMVDFHKRMQNGKMPPAEALREAQLEFLRSADTEERKPINWAAFGVIGSTK